MKNLFPDYEFKNVAAIDKTVFDGQKLLIFDIDNTLFLPESTETKPEILGWFRKVKNDYHCICLSNSYSIEQRKGAISKILGVEVYTSPLKKPNQKLFLEVVNHYKVEPSKTTMIGDMRMTDILFGNRGGAQTILFKPLGPEKLNRIKLARTLENTLISILSILRF